MRTRAPNPYSLFPNPDSRGFTLIEVLIAIVVIATGLVLIVEGMARSQEAMGISQNLIAASRLAEEKITELEMTARQGHFIRSGTDSGRERINGRVFEWAQRISVYPDASLVDQDKINQAEVFVKWKEGPVRKNEFKAATLFANREKKQ